LRNAGIGAGLRMLTAPNPLQTPTAYSVGKGQFAVALAEMASGAPLLVYGQGFAKPFQGKDDMADVYLQILPSK
jgi:hypothetical protein